MQLSMRCLVAAAMTMTAIWSTTQGALGYSGSPPYDFSGANCSGVYWTFSNHSHGCDGGASAASCGAQCTAMESTVIGHGCTGSGETSSGSCTCENLNYCCEPNGCAPGHGGTVWGPQYCVGGPGADACGCCNEGQSPIILSLRGNGVHLSSAQEGVRFDFAGDGTTLQLAWPESPDDVWLVLDRNGNGLIDSGQELFGTATILSSGQRASNGYEALAELDTNLDGLVDAQDPRFDDLFVWRDFVRNGTVDRARGELVPMRRAGIVALSVRYEESSRIDEYGNAYRYRAPVLFSETPHRRFSWDVFLTVAEQ